MPSQQGGGWRHLESYEEVFGARCNGLGTRKSHAGLWGLASGILSCAAKSEEVAVVEAKPMCQQDLMQCFMAAEVWVWAPDLESHVSLCFSGGHENALSVYL